MTVIWGGGRTPQINFMQKVSIFGVSRGERGNLHWDGNSRPTFSLKKTQKDVVTLGPEQQAGGGAGKFFKKGQGGIGLWSFARCSRNPWL